MNTYCFYCGNGDKLSENETCNYCGLSRSKKAKRSGVLQGCPPSATGSADARAADEAGADSSGRSADKAARRDGEPSPTEIAHHMNAMMDELKWFYEHGIKLHLSPTEKGWSIKFSIPDTSADAHSAA